MNGLTDQMLQSPNELATGYDRSRSGSQPEVADNQPNEEGV